MTKLEKIINSNVKKNNNNKKKYSKHLHNINADYKILNIKCLDNATNDVFLRSLAAFSKTQSEKKIIIPIISFVWWLDICFHEIVTQKFLHTFGYSYIGVYHIGK